MPSLSYLHQLFSLDQCQPTSIRCGGKIGHSNVPGARVSTSIRGGRTLSPRVKRYWCHGCKRTFNDLTDPAPPEQAVAAALDSGDVSPLSFVFVAAYCQRAGRPWPDQLSLVLVATECRHLLRNRSSIGGDSGSG